MATVVFDLLDPGWRSALLEGLRDDGVVGELLENLDPDDRAELLDELPANVTSRLLSGLSADASQRVRLCAAVARFERGDPNGLAAIRGALS